MKTKTDICLQCLRDRHKHRRPNQKHVMVEVYNLLFVGKSCAFEDECQYKLERIMAK